MLGVCGLRHQVVSQDAQRGYEVAHEARLAHTVPVYRPGVGFVWAFVWGSCGKLVVGVKVGRRKVPGSECLAHADCTA